VESRDGATSRVKSTPKGGHYGTEEGERRATSAVLDAGPFCILFPSWLKPRLSSSFLSWLAIAQTPGTELHLHSLVHTALESWANTGNSTVWGGLRILRPLSTLYQPSSSFTTPETGPGPAPVSKAGLAHADVAICTRGALSRTEPRKLTAVNDRLLSIAEPALTDLLELEKAAPAKIATRICHGLPAWLKNQ
jgi:hypothetical protein